MKQFYTERDLEDMHAAGVVEIQTHDGVVLTDVAREKAIALGMQLVAVEPADDGRPGPGMPRMAIASRKNPLVAASASPSPLHRENAAGPPVDSVLKIKNAVIARLGTDKYNDLLDKIIPQVMAQLKK